MRNLLNFLAKYNHLFTFLILEVIALHLLTNGNSYHNTRIVKGTRSITLRWEKRITNFNSYFQLREINKRLLEQNTMLAGNLERLERKVDTTFSTIFDEKYSQQYTYTAAEVVKNSVSRQKNFFTLDKGEKQGISVDMAVISLNCAAGIIVGVSENYSVAMSLLNLDCRLSARIKTNGYFGSLTWDGREYDHVILSEIPQHVTFGIGDTVETTGYSTIFPEGILIGTISDFEKSGSDFYRIKVSLATDFRKLYFVNVVGNLKKKEQLELEKSFQ